MSTAMRERTFPLIDFDAFHQHELPGRIATGNGRLAAADLGGVAPLGLSLTDGRAYTYVPAGQTVEIVAGVEAASTVAELTPELWSDFAHELRTGPGLFYAGKLMIPRGDFATLRRWEPAIRALYHGRPVYDPERARPRSDDGRLLGLDTSFTLADRDDEIRDFLDRAGYAVVRGVLGEKDIAELRDAIDEQAAQAEPADRRSWWARKAGGEQVLCRLLYTGLRSPRIAGLNDDARIQRLGSLAGAELVATPDRMDGHAVIIKNTGIVDGLSDLPWHVDCGLGGHSVFCPVLQLSIFIDDATPETGSLDMLAGSNRYSTHVPTPEQEGELPIARLVARAGDCSLHYGDTLHAAPAPTRKGGKHRCRRSIVMSFFQPRLLDIIGPGQSFNDVLFASAGGPVEGR